MILLTILSLLVLLIYLKLIKPLSYWKDRGVVHKKPWPLVGNSSDIFFQRKSFFQFVKDIYNEFPNDRYFGVHQFNSPALYIRDLDLIKTIAIKDFDYFTDHVTFVSEQIEPLMAKNLFNLKGQQWRDMRSTLSPTFTSNKMKMMFGFISECAQEVIKYLENHTEDLHDIEIKDVFTRYTNDVIASVAFGVKCNSLEDTANTFYEMGKDAMTVGGEKFIKLAIFNYFPLLAKVFNPKLLPAPVSKFFRSIITETLAKRENEGFVRKDMIHLLLEVRKGKLTDDDDANTQETGYATVAETNLHRSAKKRFIELTEEDIAAQSLLFFFAGFESSGSLMSFISYELAINEDIQNKLLQEIDETLNNSHGKITYEELFKMKYLDMVVSETLRKWTTGFQIDRECVKNYTIEPVNAWEKPVVIEKGTLVLFPVIGIHHDPKYFPNPDVFDPERFSDENKQNVKHNLYFPFGVGPRSCIGSRFALMQTKILMFYLLSKFKIFKTDKTPIPLTIDKKAFLVLGPAEGFWLGLKLRNEN
ncbi:hypothetical protein RN001_013377 [Aquatica leii]|uniref:Cytochrome P450 n=1 Tax=Aquatica leii TaxID=1421715 RepID=A0AAN7NZZ4_9COLE|nr:hypothetical protein RN001_013377 [Aquatica leii]